MNMALTTEQLAEAYEVLVKIKQLVTQGKDLAKAGKAEESKKSYD